MVLGIIPISAQHLPQYYLKTLRLLLLLSCYQRRSHLPLN